MNAVARRIIARMIVTPVKGRMLSEGRGMDEARFVSLVTVELRRIEAALECCGLDLDLEPKADGVLEVGFDDGSKLIINRHLAAREIWVAARSGGMHFRPDDSGRWIASRDGDELYAALSRVLSEHAGEVVTLSAAAG
jgi:CyaY protein